MILLEFRDKWHNRTAIVTLVAFRKSRRSSIDRIVHRAKSFSEQKKRNFLSRKLGKRIFPLRAFSTKVFRRIFRSAPVSVKFQLRSKVFDRVPNWKSATNGLEFDRIRRTNCKDFFDEEKHFEEESFFSSFSFTRRLWSSRSISLEMNPKLSRANV